MNINLYVYSGTGNTWGLAEHLQSTFQISEAVQECKIYDIVEAIKDKTVTFVNTFSDADVIGIGVPIYYFGEPIGVIEWLDLLPNSCFDGKFCFIFSTAQNSSPSSLQRLYKQLVIKGANVHKEFVLFFSSTYLHIN